MKIRFPWANYSNFESKKRQDFPILSTKSFASMCLGASITAKDKRQGPKVFALADGTFVKLFRKKRFSSAAWYPYAERFVDNALQLKLLDIPSPEVLGSYTLETNKVDLVHYRPIGSLTMRQMFRSNAFTPQVAEQLNSFIRTLHQKGVFFRSLHFGNIVLIENGQFGLIDVSDMKFKGRPLYNFEVSRNYAHLKRDKEARTALNLD
jgi:hypothetical protein